MTPSCDSIFAAALSAHARDFLGLLDGDPSTHPGFVFVRRADGGLASTLDEHLRTSILRTNYRMICLHGPSGVGKSWLTRLLALNSFAPLTPQSVGAEPQPAQSLPKGSLYLAATEMDTLESLIDTVDALLFGPMPPAFEVHERVLRDEQQHEQRMSIAFHDASFAVARHTTQFATVTLAPKGDDAMTRLRSAGNTHLEGKILVFDEFSAILDRRIQEEVLHLLQSLARRMLKVVLVTTQTPLGLTEGQWQRRTLPLPVDPWSQDELAKIATVGFFRRGVGISKSEATRLAEFSMGMPHRMQKLCLNLCELVPSGETVTRALTTEAVERTARTTGGRDHFRECLRFLETIESWRSGRVLLEAVAMGAYPLYEWLFVKTLAGDINCDANELCGFLRALSQMAARLPAVQVEFADSPDDLAAVRFLNPNFLFYFKALYPVRDY